MPFKKNTPNNFYVYFDVGAEGFSECYQDSELSHQVGMFVRISDPVG